MSLIKIGLNLPPATKAKTRKKGPNTLERLLQDAQVSDFLNLNTFNGIEWLNREQFQALTDWLQVIGAAKVMGNKTNSSKEFGALVEQHAEFKTWREAEAKSDYQVEKLLELTAEPVLKKPRKPRIERVVAKPKEGLVKEELDAKPIKPPAKKASSKASASTVNTTLSRKNASQQPSPEKNANHNPESKTPDEASKPTKRIKRASRTSKQ
jgi:hypothetical protein